MTTNLRGWQKCAAVVVSLGCFAGCGGEDGGETGGQSAGAGGAAGAAGAGGGGAPPEPESWPMYGKDLAGSRSTDATRIAADNVADLERVWKKALDGCTGTPAVVDGVLYVADWFGNLYALDPEDGDEHWSTKVGLSSIADSPLVMDLPDGGRRIYVGDGVGNLISVDAESGEVLWTKELDAHPNAYIYSSPVGADGRVIVGVASIELALIKSTFTFEGSVVALDAESGELAWRVPVAGPDVEAGPGVSVWSSPAVDLDRKTLYIGTGQSYKPPASPRSDSVIAIRYDTGDVEWVHQFTENDVFVIFGGGSGPDYDVGAAPVVFSAGGRDLVGVGDKGGNFYALDRDTGEVAWSRPLTPGSALGGVMSSAAYADGVLWVTSNDFRVGGGIDTPSEGDKNVTFALDAENGDVIWEKEASYPTVGSLARAGGVVFHSSTEGTLHARDAESGKELWTDAAYDSMASGASVWGDMVFACWGFTFIGTTGVAKGGLVAYRLP